MVGLIILTGSFIYHLLQIIKHDCRAVDVVDAPEVVALGPNLFFFIYFPLNDYLFRYSGYSLADTEKDEDRGLQLPEHLPHQQRGNRA